MKKHLIFTLLGLCIFSFLHAQNPIPNPGFENWSGSGLNSLPTGWNRLSLLIINSKVEKTTDKQEGAAAVKITTDTADLSLLGMGKIPLPGFLSIGKVDMAKLLELANGSGELGLSDFSSILTGGVRVTKMLKNVKGYYKYAPKGTDSMAAIVYLTKYNTDAKMSVPIAMGSFSTGNTPNYTQFVADVEYLNGYEGETPDTMNVIFLSSAGMGVGGSALYIDNLSVEYTDGTFCNSLTKPAVEFTTYPNPAANRFTVTLAKENTKNTIEVYNINGVRVYSQTAIGKSTEIDLSTQKAGTYIVKVIADGVETSQNVVLTK